jgi:hypothetical protein
MNKPNRISARPLRDLVTKTMTDVFQRQGFASAEIVSHWPDVVGQDIAALAQPLRIQWPRRDDTDMPAPATLVLRVEGPAALEIQHLSGVIIERVNRFFGWPAIERLALRQGPLTRPPPPQRRAPPDAKAAERIAASLEVGDEDLRAALGRLGAAVKKT